MRQGADESLEVYIAHIQKLEADLSMVADDPDRIQISVTTKLRTSVTDDFTIAAIMVKTVLNSLVQGAREEHSWMFVVSPLREEEQRQITAANNIVFSDNIIYSVEVHVEFGFQG